MSCLTKSKLGWRGTNTGTINFNNVLVPAENILGSLLHGHGEFWAANVPSFIGHSATSVSGAQGLFDKTVAYVRERNLYGRPMDKLQPVSYWIAEAYAKLQACRALLYETTQRWDSGNHDPVMSAVCKASDATPASTYRTVCSRCGAAPGSWIAPG